MPWMETNTLAQRQRFIDALESTHWSMSELCERFGVSRPTGYKWRARYRAGGAGALVDRSRAPQSCPHRTAAHLVALLVAARRQYGWGTRKLLTMLQTRYPTETWPAHDVRKSVVFDHAARFGPPEHRDSFLKKAEFFFRECMAGLSKFPSRTCTRPLAILLGNGTYRGYCMRRRPKAEPPGPSDVDFGRPDPFRGQEDRVKDLLRTGRGRTRLAMALLRPTFAVHVLSHLIRRLRKRVRP
jgi:transposase